MKPPGQSNQYGYWDPRPGSRDFWVASTTEYALMRDLLFHGSYRPIDYGEWRDYRTYQQTGRTYYGRGTVDNPAKIRHAGNGDGGSLLG